MRRLRLVIWLALLVVLLTWATVVAGNDSLEDEDDDHDDSSDSFEVDDDGRIYKNPRNSPSALCPRDEDQANLMGQKCLRKCSTDEDCKSKKKKCMCDGICGMSCIKPERECEELSHPARGSVSLTGRLFGDRASYSCTHGAHVVGLVERTCQADGSWSGTTPVCKENVYCTSPPLIDHARHSAVPEQTTFDISAALTYSCYPGYATKGFPTAKCLEIDGTASWFGPDISCEPRSCGAPTDTAHGWHAGECYTFGCRVAYHCADGYQIVGRAERYCQQDGSWSPKDLPSCVLITAVQCPAPENPAHGTAIFTSSSYNSVVSYDCKYGYTLSGGATRKCGADKKWSGQMPQCKEINCGHPGPLYNGWLENIEAGTGLGAVLIFRCHGGTRMEGNTSSVCQIDGRWRYPLPRCLAPCVVPGIIHGRVLLAPTALIVTGRNETPTNGTTLVQHGETLSVDCDLNYEFLPSSPVSCNNGTWTHIPRCEPARCKKMPKNPRNGMVIAPKTDHGMKARYACKDGYTLRGSNTTECLYGNWTGVPPYCQEVYCPFPGYIENGKVMLVGNMGLYDYRPYVRKVTNNKQIMYDCDRGYILADGPPGATCIGGHWSPKELPRCVPGLHPRLRWSRSAKEAALREKRQASLENTRDIQELLALGSREQRLQRDATLSRRKRAMAMGSHTQQKQTQLGGQRGKEPSSSRKGNKNNRGNKGGIKGSKGKAGPCEPISTEPFTTIEVVKAGRNENQTFSHGTVVQVVCGKGYGLNIGFNVTAKCTRGMWKPDYPECEILPCRVPMTPHGLYRLAGATVLLNLSQDILNGEVVQFSCRHGYNVKGPGNLRCWHGEWAITAQPECSPSPCELPQITHGQYLGGYRAGLTIANGSSVSFQCDSDYAKSTVKPVECVLGELRPRTPACRLHHRGNLAPRNGSVKMPEVDAQFRGGSDISKAGVEGTELEFNQGYRRACGPPARVSGSLVYRDGEPLEDNDRSFADGTEVTFNCIQSIMGERTSWRIVCEDGSWVGRALSCEGDDFLDLAHGAFRNSSCMFRNAEPNLATFYNDQHITEEYVEFPGGSVLVSRCVDIGKYFMIGSTARKCVGGEWDGHKPVCFGLNQENDYALEKPPTILFRHQLGPIAQSNDGKLIVYPGTILHMECLWVRRFGTPKWNVTHNYRKYPEGWTTDPGRDSTLEYRLSIFHASKDDSGTFTCQTPTRHSHSVDIVVQAVHCPVIPVRKGLTLSTKATKMNTRVVFNCDNGNSLIGAQELACLPSGNWSGPVPICENEQSNPGVECPDLANLTDPQLRVSILSRGVGGRAVFSCAPGYGLRGQLEVVCQQSGDWSTPMPTCQEVQCAVPPTPDNGYIQGAGPYKAGDVIQFNCNPEFMMEGQPIIACQESGRWSGVVPKCVQACSYPGTTISGRMSAVKFYYRIGESVTFSCDSGLELRGTPMLRCLRNGKWSNAIPTCAAPAAAVTAS